MSDMLVNRKQARSSIVGDHSSRSSQIDATVHQFGLDKAERPRAAFFYDGP